MKPDAKRISTFASDLGGLSACYRNEATSGGAQRATPQSVRATDLKNSAAGDLPIVVFPGKSRFRVSLCGQKGISAKCGHCCAETNLLMTEKAHFLSNGVTSGNIDFDLGDVFAVERVAFWNWSTSQGGVGLRQVEVFTSSDSAFTSPRL